MSKVPAYVHLADKPWFERFLEIFPGAMTWLFLLAPVLLSLIRPIWVAYFIIGFDLFWLVKSVRLSYFLLRGYEQLNRHGKINWRQRLIDLRNIPAARAEAEQQLKAMLRQHPRANRRWQWTAEGSAVRRQYIEIDRWLQELQNLEEKQNTIIDPREIYHAVILATYNEGYEILEPSVRALTEVDYSHKRLILIVAYEERGGAQTEENAKRLVKEYGEQFFRAAAIKHPSNIPGEIKGKGANITYSARQLTRYVEEAGIDPMKVIVTTLDSDHRTSTNYFNHLTYMYATDPNRQYKSYQPIPLFFNNIWDAPAPMRVIATGNSFWLLIETMRPHRLRNFAAHAQGLKTLIDTDFWSVTSIVEDGHQYWRTYFTYDGQHEVVPLYSPIYQDAVLAETYLKSYKAQYLQLRRWAWGVSDFSFVVKNALKNRRIGWANKGLHIFRLFEGHFSWATAALIISFVAWLPLLLNREFGDQFIAHQLPIIASRLMTLTMAGLLVTIFISLRSLPPRPRRYAPLRSVLMVLQWALLPVTSIVFGSFVAIDAQTRLMFGRYLDFRVTEKSRRS
jgi:hypothetical protein